MFKVVGVFAVNATPSGDEGGKTSMLPPPPPGQELVEAVAEARAEWGPSLLVAATEKDSRVPRGTPSTTMPLAVVVATRVPFWNTRYPTASSPASQRSPIESS